MKIAFIRLNPDAYKIAGQRGTLRRRQRYEMVLRLIRDREPTEKPLEVQYCFYDVDQDRFI
jgi:hypothetical protein